MPRKQRYEKVNSNEATATSDDQSDDDIVEVEVSENQKEDVMGQKEFGYITTTSSDLEKADGAAKKQPYARRRSIPLSKTNSLLDMNEEKMDNHNDSARNGSESNLRERQEKQNKIRVFDLIVVTLLIVAAACLVFFFALNQRKITIGSELVTSSPVPSLSPTSAPSSSLKPSILPTISSVPTIADLREKFILQQINSASPNSSLPSTPDILTANFTNTPQFHAAEWLIFKDGLRVHQNHFEEEIVERFALAAIHFATNGTTGSNWMSNFSICEWEGVTCDRDPPYNVTQLSMVNFNLRGTIPAEISLLHSLTDLFLDHNFLRKVDVAIYSLVHLQTLDLSNNELQGTFPTEISNLKNLHDLYLSFNDLTGQVNDIHDLDLPKLGMCD